MATLTYDGSARDHDVTPAVAKIGSDGKPEKRKYVKPAVYVFKPIDTYDLWGVKFPKGVPVEVGDHELVTKAKALGCFEIVGAVETKPKRGRKAKETPEE